MPQLMVVSLTIGSNSYQLNPSPAVIDLLDQMAIQYTDESHSLMQEAFREYEENNNIAKSKDLTTKAAVARVRSDQLRFHCEAFQDRYEKAQEKLREEKKPTSRGSQRRHPETVPADRDWGG